MSFDKLVTEVAIDLFGRRKHGHTGEIAYQNGGGKLFAQFTHANPDYYPYHGEITLLATNRDAIAELFADVEHAIVVGPGPASSFSRKEYPILEKLPKLKAVSLVDLSADFNQQAKGVIQSNSQAMRRRVKGNITNYDMDFHDAGAVIPAQGKTAVFVTGGLVSNVHNAPLNGFPDQDMQGMLRACRDLAGEDGFVILGYDTNQWHESLNKAYDQSLAPFIKNIMQIIADHTPGIQGFDPHPDNFRYEMQWHKKASQVAHTIVFERPQRFTITDNGQTHTFTFDTGDELVMMSSIKPLQQKMTQLASYCGLQTVNGYFDQHGLVEHIFKSAPVKPPVGAPTPLQLPLAGPAKP
ncbi:MAG: L-histidine N(alpha)-methyltransferase [Micavibrio sp.]